jgi:hypothetical protein
MCFYQNNRGGPPTSQHRLARIAKQAINLNRDEILRYRDGDGERATSAFSISADALDLLHKAHTAWMGRIVATAAEFARYSSKDVGYGRTTQARHLKMAFNVINGFMGPTWPVDSVKGIVPLAVTGDDGPTVIPV